MRMSTLSVFEPLQAGSGSSYSDPDLQAYRYEPRKAVRTKEVDYK